LAQPQGIARVVLFLASDAASYMTAERSQKLLRILIFIPQN
jgi:NAD(P)-dependent dehydrogenase (short-subunit alcohol dehydrogenase family)